MLVRSLGWKDLSFVAEYSKAFEANVGLLGQYAAKFPIIGTVREDGTTMEAGTVLTRNDMARLLYNYLYTDKRTVSVGFNHAGHPEIVEEFTPVLTAFGYRVFEAYVTGVLDWAIDMRVPAPGLVNPANNSWYPVRLFGSTVNPTTNDINLVNRTHNVRLSWVTVGRRDANDPSITTTDTRGEREPTANTAVPGVTYIGGTTVARSHTATYTLAQLGLTAENHVDMLGRKVRVRTNTRSASVESATTATFIGEMIPVDLGDSRLVTPALTDNNTKVAGGFTLPYDPISATAVAGRDSIIRTDSLYVFNAAATGVNYSGNKLRSATSNINAPIGESHWGGDRNVGDENPELINIVNTNRNGQQYQMYLVHNGYFGSSAQKDITQEYFYVMRPYRVGIRMADATNGAQGTRFYDSEERVLRVQELEARRGEDVGALRRDGGDVNALRTGVAWANANFTNEADEEGKPGEAFFYELRGYNSEGTRQLNIHAKLVEQISGGLTAASGGTIFFAGGPAGSPASMTFNRYIARERGAWSGDAFRTQVAVAGTQGGQIGAGERDSTYALFSIPATARFADANASRFVLAMRMTAPSPADFAWSEYAVVTGEPSGDWNVHIRNSAGTIVAMGTFVEVLNVSAGRTEQIIINSLDGANGLSAGRLNPGDRIRLVSRGADNVSWNVIRATAAHGNSQATVPATWPTRPDVNNVGIAGATRNFAQTTADNTTFGGVAREYFFRQVGAAGSQINRDFLSSVGVTSISASAAIAAAPTTENAAQRAIITNNTKVVIYSSTDGKAAVSTGTAAQLAAFLDRFLQDDATNLRVVAERAHFGAGVTIQSAGVARYIFLDTTRGASSISMTPTVEFYGLITAHQDHWFLGAPLVGTGDIVWRRGVMKTYNASRQLVDLVVCWPNDNTADFARGAFVAVMTGETREDSNGDKVPVVRYLDNTVRVDGIGAGTTASRLDVARSWERLPNDPGVSLRVAEITDYVAGNIMTLADGRAAIDLTGRTNSFNFISREDISATGATAPIWQEYRYWNNDPAGRSADSGHGLWHNSLNNRGASEAWSPGRINERNFEELRRQGITLWAIAYQANVEGNPLLSLTIVIDFGAGVPTTRTLVASEILAEFARSAAFATEFPNQIGLMDGENADARLARFTDFVNTEVVRVTKLKADFDGLIPAEKDLVVAGVAGVTTPTEFDNLLGAEITRLKGIITNDVTVYLTTVGDFRSFIVTEGVANAARLREIAEFLRKPVVAPAVAPTTILSAAVVDIFNELSSTTMAAVIAAIDAAVRAQEILASPLYTRWNVISATKTTPYTPAEIADVREFKAIWDGLATAPAFTFGDVPVGQLALAIARNGALRGPAPEPPSTARGTLNVVTTMQPIVLRLEALGNAVGSITLADFITLPDMWRLAAAGGAALPLTVGPTLTIAQRDANVALAKLALEEYAKLSAADKEDATVLLIFESATATLNAHYDYEDKFEVIVQTLFGGLDADSLIANVVTTLNMIEIALGTGLSETAQRIARGILLDEFEDITDLDVLPGLIAAIYTIVDAAVEADDLTLAQTFTELRRLLNLANNNAIALYYAGYNAGGRNDVLEALIDEDDDDYDFAIGQLRAEVVALQSRYYAAREASPSPTRDLAFVALVNALTHSSLTTSPAEVFETNDRFTRMINEIDFFVFIDEYADALALVEAANKVEYLRTVEDVTALSALLIAMDDLEEALAGLNTVVRGWVNARFPSGYNPMIPARFLILRNMILAEMATRDILGEFAAALAFAAMDEDDRREYLAGLLTRQLLLDLEEAIEDLQEYYNEIAPALGTGSRAEIDAIVDSDLDLDPEGGDDFVTLLQEIDDELEIRRLLRSDFNAILAVAKLTATGTDARQTHLRGLSGIALLNLLDELDALDTLYNDISSNPGFVAAFNARVAADIDFDNDGVAVLETAIKAAMKWKIEGALRVQATDAPFATPGVQVETGEINNKITEAIEEILEALFEDAYGNVPIMSIAVKDVEHWLVAGGGAVSGTAGIDALGANVNVVITVTVNFTGIEDFGDIFWVPVRVTAAP
jgi:hypothetical protein